MANLEQFERLNIELSRSQGEVRALCPKCSASRKKSHDRCLSVNVTDGLWHCWHCGWKGSLRTGASTGRQTTVRVKASQTDNEKCQAIVRVWRASRPIQEGDPVYQYLSNRGLTLSLEPERRVMEFGGRIKIEPGYGVSPALRYHPRLPYHHGDGHISFHPAMVAAIVPHAFPVPCGIHRTYLTSDGHKASVPTVKKLMPAPAGALSGAAIEIDPAGAELCVTEGIETALAVRQMTGKPVWAAISAGGMAALRVPERVEVLIICGDHDRAGIEAGDQLKARMLRQGRRVKVCYPATPGYDWLDELHAQEGE